MPSRRFHSKSRHGCVQCKKRKVKCDIVRPVCGNCARRKDKCHYVIGVAGVMWTPPRTLQAGQSSPASPSRTISGSPVDSNSDARTNSELTLNAGPIFHLSPNADLSLLEWFVSDVSPTLSHRPDTQKAWALDVGRRPIFQPDASYLSHILIAISALHASLTQPSLSPAQKREYREVGLYHQNAALALIQPVLPSLKDETSQVAGLFGAAWLIFLFNVSLPRQCDRKEWVVDEIVKLSELSKGVVVVISAYRASSAHNEEEAKSLVMSGPLRGFFGHFLPWRHQKVSPAVRRQKLPQTLQHILARIEVDESIPLLRKQLYHHAIDELAVTIVAMALNPRHPAIIFMWLISTHRSFVQLIAARDTFALQIFRAYGVWAAKMDQVWFARTWGRNVIDAADATLASHG
ncbi:hypothetical protein PISL3812_08957 [Talaromyces islandicus]|uniref:Zn(2)-C6 fungal-type domain-containing protein n=1 Tax=Talaromyces islandicus TaxID=28573 RepID=A0A0U1M8F0_TALIS|nr:hypothetical protein PISL3812_08957 [Talaromyces islandicus]